MMLPMTKKNTDADPHTTPTSCIDIIILFLVTTNDSIVETYEGE